ncbi:MAG: argininosuccinate lyase [Cyclobacteriaceae bacterium]
MKLWQKSTDVNKQIDTFTVGNDRELDLVLAPFDVLGSLAHIRMLEKIGLLKKEEWKQLDQELKEIYKDIQKGGFKIADDVEDIHSQVEFLLTQKLGDVGKKIHSGRSRNDQVLVDLKMYFRHEIKEIVQLTSQLFQTLVSQSEKYKGVLMPGYTHMQVAMPSSVGLWFGAYAESLVDDLHSLKAAFEVVNKSPLGSAAGYGSSFPLDREMTAELLGFSQPNYNVVYAQMTRGRSEKAMAHAIATIGTTLSKLSMDVCLYMGQNFGFFTFPDELTTGSSIMPHKKNPDVFELVRGRCNQLQALPVEIGYILNNLPSGYHRDLQQLKEGLFPALQTTKECLEILNFSLSQIIVSEDIINDPKYDYLFTVELVNELVLGGMPFRDAYKEVGLQIEAGNYKPDRKIKHTHVGSIGNLGNDKIQQKYNEVVSGFDFESVDSALTTLIE